MRDVLANDLDVSRETLGELRRRSRPAMKPAPHAERCEKCSRIRYADWTLKLRPDQSILNRIEL